MERAREKRPRLKDPTWEKYKCPFCTELLKEPQQLSCGHWACLQCVKAVTESEGVPSSCPVSGCSERIASDGDDAAYFYDRAVKREIDNFAVECFYSGKGCVWQGKYSEFAEHMKMCEFSLVPCQLCRLTIQADKVEEHEKICPKASILCPYHSIGCSNENAMPRPSLEEHCRESEIEHALQLVKTVKSAEKQSNDALLKAEDIAKQLRLMTVGHDKLDSGCFEAVDRDSVRGQGEAISEARLKASTSVHLRLRNEEAPFETLPTGFPRRDMGFDKKLLQPLFDSMKQEMLTVLRVDLSDKASADSRRKEAEITTLKEKIIQLEKTIRTKTTEAEDRDFRLSLIENSNYEGNMVWKIPQFSQRKADAESGKYTSIFSLPFYTGRYGYKMCLRLYILGDGIGKNTHMSLFFVVMRGEFDNILQWPFTHKVTFKLINQKGARDVVDTFQPDPMSSSFRKPKSDMNIASGCPRFVSHQELQNGSFIEDDTIFIKCVIDKATLRNP